MLIRYSFRLFWQFVYVFVQFALPHIMGWDQALTSHPQSPSSAPASRPRVERPNPDSEWDRWSFLVAPDQRRVSNTTASRHRIVWKCGTFELCFLCIQLSEVFVSDFMALKRLKLGRSTIKPYVCSVHASILHWFVCGILCLLFTVMQTWCICDLTFICKITEFSSACYILTILHPCMVAQAVTLAQQRECKICLELHWKFI
jgi:hypothetical protein